MDKFKKLSALFEKNVAPTEYKFPIDTSSCQSIDTFLAGRGVGIRPGELFCAWRPFAVSRPPDAGIFYDFEYRPESK
jgi:hypothetical protein